MAFTVAQLEAISAASAKPWIAPGANFTASLREVLPRLYNMGLWKDVTYEASFSGANGYITLPPDTDAVLACTVNNSPRPVRSLWHDIRIVGRQAVLAANFGIVDDGYTPVKLDMVTVQDLDLEADVVEPTTLSVHLADTTTVVAATAYAGTITLVYDTGTGKRTATQSTTGDLSFACSGGVKSIVSIVYSAVPAAIDLYDAAFPDSVITTIPAGTGVLRLRRFRTSSQDSLTTVHLLLKRSAPENLTSGTIVHLGNLGAIKHGMLGLIADDNSSHDAAAREWAICGKLLDEELMSILGAAKPSLSLDLTGCQSAAPICNLM